MDLTTKNIKLRALEPADLNFLFKVENDTSFWEVGNTQTPFSKHILEQYIANSHQDIYEAKQIRFIIEHNNKAIGMVDLFDYNPQHHKAGIGILLLKDFQSKGFANEALKLMITYSFSLLNLHQIYASIATDNTKSINLFKKNGFKKIGTLKDWIFYNKQFKDVVFFQLIDKK